MVNWPENRHALLEHGKPLAKTGSCVWLVCSLGTAGFQPCAGSHRLASK